jgi:hypothetical protein
MALDDYGFGYSQRKRAAAGSRDATLAQNSYSRFLSQQRGTRNLADLDRGMTRGVEKLGASFGRRGLRNSGIFNQAQSDYAQKWLQQKTDIGDELSAALRQADLGDASAVASYEMTAADLEAEKAARIAATAAALDQMRPFMGG